MELCVDDMVETCSVIMLLRVPIGNLIALHVIVHVRCFVGPIRVRHQACLLTSQGDCGRRCAKSIRRCHFYMLASLRIAVLENRAKRHEKRNERRPQSQKDVRTVVQTLCRYRREDIEEWAREEAEKDFSRRRRRMFERLEADWLMDLWQLEIRWWRRRWRRAFRRNPVPYDWIVFLEWCTWLEWWKLQNASVYRRVGCCARMWIPPRAQLL